MCSVCKLSGLSRMLRIGFIVRSQQGGFDEKKADDEVKERNVTVDPLLLQSPSCRFQIEAVKFTFLFVQLFPSIVLLLHPIFVGFVQSRAGGEEEEDTNRMEFSSLKRQAAYMKKGFFDQGYLDEQFYQLEDLQDDVSPNFVEEVVTLFFKDSSRLLSNIEHALENCSPDFQKLDTYLHQFKGSTSSIGALRVKNECTVLGEYCNNENIDRCLRTFEKVKREHAILKQKLEAYFQLLRQIVPAELAT